MTAAQGRCARLLAFALALLAAAMVGPGEGSAMTQAVLWLPSGVAIAGLWLLGLRAWLVIAACTLLHRLLTGYGPGVALPAALGSSAEAVVGVLILRRLGLRGDLARLREVLAVFAAACLAPLASILCSWIARSLPGKFHITPFYSGWDGWWRMNALGILTVLPLALTWLRQPFLPLRPRTAVEAIAVGVAVVGLLWGVMRFVPPGPTAIMLLYMVLPIALFAAIRFGSKGATAAAAVGTLFVAIESWHHGASFITIPLAERHIAVQIFLFTLAGAPLVIGGLIAEREASVSRWLQSEGLRQALFRLLPDTTYRIGADGRLLDVFVPEGVKLPQLRQHLIGRNLADITPPAVADKMLAALAAAHRGLRPEPVEYQVDSSEGVRAHEARYVQLTPGEVLGVVRDITKRKRAERMLAWQAEILELIATGRPNQEIFAALVRGIERFHERSVCSILQLQGRRLHLACAPSLPPAYNAAIDGIEIGPSRGSCGTAAHDNRTVIVADTATDFLWQDYRDLALAHDLRACWSVPVRSPQGEVLGTFAIYHHTPRAPDAAEIALVERAAVLAGIAIDRERREDLLASISRNVVEGLYRSKPGRGLVYVNQAFARLFGYDSPEAMLRVISASACDNAEHRADVERLIAGFGFPASEEVRLHRRDGSAFWGLVSSTGVCGPDGIVTSYDGAIADITPRKQLEDQLRQAQKMEAVGKLAGGVAHDFNNMLTVITGYAETIRRALPPASRLGGDVDEVLKAAGRAAGLTRQLLAFSRQQMLSPQVLDLAEVVEQFGGMLRRVIGEDITLQTQPAGRAACVRVDRGQIEQVILNLVVNARDAMPAGGRLTITTAAVEVDNNLCRIHVDLVPGPYVALSVRDTGTGMSREVQARAFDPFFTTKEMGKGTGLGLATVYGIVRQSGGSVWLESSPAAGTAVWIYLPRVSAAPEVASPTAGLPPQPANATILVVEDDPSVRDLVQRTLEFAGYMVLVAVDGVAALELARGGAGFDLLVTDLVMPRMGGRNLAEKLTAERPGLPVLFMSGYANVDQEPIGAALAAGELLQKPFLASDLLERTATLLAARSRAAR